MANAIRRIVSSSKDDTQTVLSIGAQWESLRAAYWGHYGDTAKADECFFKAQQYELELKVSSKEPIKGRGFYPSLELVSRQQVSAFVISCQMQMAIQSWHFDG